MKYSKGAGYFQVMLVFVAILLLAGCRGGSQSTVSVEAQVMDAYESYLLLTDAGVTSMMELRLKGDIVEGEITKPDDADLEAFFLSYSESPLCQNLNDKNEIVACLVASLRERGCVKMATCSDCIYSCD
ncbi:MAG TPA: hypothetical protein DEG09_01465 [Marinilabiliaceae bacterium]|nr:hypothetical protein [Marinilabiliaceae bacterium]HBX87267.1 hypothetical protein [Marinilabiliaceae bacterium]